MTSTGRLTDRPALITGGASGIGAATARLFAREGARVLIADIDAPRGESVVEEIRRQGGEACFRQTDVTDRSDVREMVREGHDVLGGLAILFNNAIARSDREGDEDGAWDILIESGLSAVWAASMEAIPLLEASQTGSIVTTASVAGARFGFSTEAYSAAKAGVVGLTRRMAKTLGPRGIRVNCICPGLIETPLWQQPGEPEPEMASRWRQMTPLRRTGAAEEVASVALFLAGDESSFISGQEIVVDGGFSTGFLFESGSWLEEGA